MVLGNKTNSKHQHLKSQIYSVSHGFPKQTDFTTWTHKYVKGLAINTHGQTAQTT